MRVVDVVVGVLVEGRFVVPGGDFGANRGGDARGSGGMFDGGDEGGGGAEDVVEGVVDV